MSVLPFTPVGPVLIVVPKKAAPLSTASGIQIADVYDEGETSGMIVAIGTGFRCACCDAAREVPYQIGDFVLFSRSAGEVLPFAVEGQDCVLLKEDEVLAIVDPDAVCEVIA